MMGRNKTDICIIGAGSGGLSVAAGAAQMGARVVLVGIPSDDRTSFSASTARRKGLTIQLCRRMAHTYPRAIALAESGIGEQIRPRDGGAGSLDEATPTAGNWNLHECVLRNRG